MSIVRRTIGSVARAARSQFLPSLVVVVTSLVGACTDSPIPTTDRATGSPRFVASVAGPDSEWNYFAADITIRRDGRGLTARGPSTTQIRLERQLQNDGWQTRVNLRPEAPNRADSGAVTTVVFDPRGAVVATYDASGHKIGIPPRSGKQRSLAQVAELATAIDGGKAASRIDHRKTLPVRRLPSTAKPAMSPTGRQWLDQLIVTPSARRRTLATLQTRYGLAADPDERMNHFRREGAGSVEEVIFDAHIGAVVRQSVGRSTGEFSRVMREFIDTGGGRYVLHRLIFEHGAAGRSVARLTEEFNNVQAESRSR